MKIKLIHTFIAMFLFVIGSCTLSQHKDTGFGGGQFETTSLKLPQVKNKVNEIYNSEIQPNSAAWTIESTGVKGNLIDSESNNKNGLPLILINNIEKKLIPFKKLIPQKYYSKIQKNKKQITTKFKNPNLSTAEKIGRYLLLIGSILLVLGVIYLFTGYSLDDLVAALVISISGLGLLVIGGLVLLFS